jgi:hypothetical protein
MSALLGGRWWIRGVGRGVRGSRGVCGRLLGDVRVVWKREWGDGVVQDVQSVMQCSRTSRSCSAVSWGAP